MSIRETPVTKDQLEALRRADTPSICNALDDLRIADPSGYSDTSLRCWFPELAPTVGYAVTVRVDSTSPDGHYLDYSREPMLEMYKALRDSPRPSILVYEEAGPEPRKGLHFGDGVARLAMRFGAIGAVTGSGLRDVAALRALRSFHCFSTGVVPGHGCMHVVEVGVPVVVAGMTVHSGDLLHGDINGIVVVPREHLDRILHALDIVRQRETAFCQLVDDLTITDDQVLIRTCEMIEEFLPE